RDGNGDGAAPLLPGTAGLHLAEPAGGPVRRGRPHPGGEPVREARRAVRLLSIVAASAVLLPFASTLTAQEATPLRGDIDQDGRVTAVDALAVLSGVVGKTLPEGYLLLPNGDADGDGRLSAIDALLLLA